MGEKRKVKFTRTNFSPATTPVGAVTLTWAETFTPGDNPDTPADESLLPQQYRIRTFALPANTLESVANLNDTDGDGIVDSDSAVNPSTVAAGFKEVELMRLEITGPSVGRVKVTASGGSVSFWKKSTKENPITASPLVFKRKPREGSGARKRQELIRIPVLRAVPAPSHLRLAG